MTKSAFQPMQSVGLVQGAEPISCYICDAVSTVDAELCHRCAAPMALAHQARHEQVAPRMIAVIGASEVGKTVFLGMLMDMISRQPERMCFLARGAFSISLQQRTMAALSRCEFPTKTCNEPDRWNWVHCEIECPDQLQKTELIMPDMAGEAILEEVDHPNTYRVIRSLLKKAAGAMILMDAAQLRDGDRNQDYFTMKLLSYMSEMEPHEKVSWSQRPVALIFTKVDQAEECRNDPAEFARTHAAGMWQHCQQRFHEHQFFAASVVGCCAWRESSTEGRRRVPLRVEPHGIIEPFEWLLEKLSAKSRRRGWWGESSMSSEHGHA